jgi:hypothetical protein
VQDLLHGLLLQDSSKTCNQKQQQPQQQHKEAAAEA